MNLLIKSYLKKYFKNIEKFDFSLINGKVKIDSVVPKLDTFTNLLNLEKLNLKIENGLIRDLTITFPINILKSSVKIFIKNVDIYISSTNVSKESFLYGLNDTKMSCDNVPTEKKSQTVVKPYLHRVIQKMTRFGLK